MAVESKGKIESVEVKAGMKNTPIPYNSIEYGVTIRSAVDKDEDLQSVIEELAAYAEQGMDTVKEMLLSKLNEMVENGEI